MATRKIVPWLGLINVVSLSLWWGGGLFFSFVAAPRIFGYLQDRLPAAPPPGVTGLTPEIGQRLAGDTVGGIFPTYFALQVVVGLLAIAATSGLVRARQPRARLRCILTSVAWVLVTTHALTVYPHSVRILDDHYRLAAEGDAAGAAASRKSFGAWHGISQMLNLATLLTVTGALVLAGWNTVKEPEKAQG